MIPTTRRRRISRGLAALAVCAAAELATGCPQLEVDDVSLASSSIDDAAFTLTVTVVVTEDDPAVDDNGDLAGGRGLLGVWLPPGWAVDAARFRASGEADFAPATPVAEGDGHFPAPFPWVPGAWSAFASPCENVGQGTFEHAVEIDVHGPPGATGVTLGISTALFDENGSNGAGPTEVAVDLSAGTASVREPPAAPAPAGLEECAPIPYDEASPPGEACSCAATGARVEGGVGLLRALILGVAD
jgi:hypothetical protein